MPEVKPEWRRGSRSIGDQPGLRREFGHPPAYSPFGSGQRELDGACRSEAGRGGRELSNTMSPEESCLAPAIGTVIAAVALYAAAVGVDGVEIVVCLEQDSTVAEDVGGYSVAGSVGELQRRAAIRRDGEELKTGWRAAGVDNAIRGQIEGRDGVFLAGNDAAWGAAGDGDLPDLPPVARLLFGGEENVLAVKGDGGIGGGGEGRRDGALAAGCHQLERGTGRKALAGTESGGGIVAGGFRIDVGDGYRCLWRVVAAQAINTA